MKHRVVVVSHAISGGSGVVARELASLLHGAGHDAWLLTPAAPARAAAMQVFEDIDASVRLPSERQIVVSTPDHPVFEHPPSDLAMAAAIVDLVERERIDTVHVHFGVPWAVSGVLARSMARTPFRLVVTLHGTDVTSLASMPAYARSLRWALEAADALVVPSASLREDLRDVMGDGIASRAIVVPNWVDPVRFHAPTRAARAALRARLGDALCRQLPDGRHAPDCTCPSGALRPPSDGCRWLVHVSNYRPVKRTAQLADVFTSIASSMDARLLLVGDGPERDVLVATLRDRGLGDQVVATGHVENPAPWMQAGDLFVLPSESESFGLAALEAMSCGTPVVAYDVGGLPELVGAAEGRLVPDGDVSALTAACRELLVDEVVRDEAGQASAARARAHHHPAQALRAHLAVYEDHALATSLSAPEA